MSLILAGIVSVLRNAAKKKRADIDVIAADPHGRRILIGECTWKNELDVAQTMDTLRSRGDLVTGYDDRSFALFVKTEELAERARRRVEGENDFMVVSAADMFSGADSSATAAASAVSSAH